MVKKIRKTIAIAVVSVDDKVDYGGGISYGKLVRGQTKAIFTATNVEAKGEIPQCKIELFQYLDAGGHIPVQGDNKKIPESLSVVKGLPIFSSLMMMLTKMSWHQSLPTSSRNRSKSYDDDEKEAIRKERSST